VAPRLRRGSADSRRIMSGVTSNSQSSSSSGDEVISVSVLARESKSECELLEELAEVKETDAMLAARPVIKSVSS
jgi:hypothetical protein